MPLTSDFTEEPSTDEPNSGEEQPLQIAVVNDHPVVVSGVARLVEQFTDQVRVIEGDSELPTILDVDVALFDTFAADAGGGEGLASLLQNPRVGRVAVFSWQNDPGAVEEAIRMGASGYLSKSLDGQNLVDAIVRIGRGETVVATGRDSSEPVMGAWPGERYGLTPRESEMLAFIAQGLSNAEIAERCYLSINSVKSYIRSAYRRIGVERRAQAVLWAMEHGLSPSPSRWLAR